MAPCGGWRWWAGLLGLLGLSAGPGAELHEGFAARPDGWKLNGAWQLTGGSLVGTTDSSHARLLIPGTSALATGSIAVRAEQTAGDAKAVRWGVFYRAADADNGYFALFRGDGAYWLGKLIGGKPVTTLTGMVGAVHASGPNLIKVSCDGARQTVAINETYLV
ncbi:MAG: hypothetical protein HYU66_11300, partial [Armatimonadetes bacterium]|nr:hypothetical protein [Armatimonadota bacterium]